LAVPIDRNSLPAGCPADQVLRLLWGEWTMHIIWILGSAGPLRFGELHRRVEGISRKVLTQRLRRMEASGLIYRDEEASAPPKVTYGLTEMARDIDRVLRLLEPVIERWSGQKAMS
jgi:DNA-binding HxlR family transcriptional regulator